MTNKLKIEPRLQSRRGNLAMKPNRIVFLLGAGASYGAGHTLPISPPLGNNLYDALAREYPSNWGPNSMIGQRYADGLRTNFEETSTNEISRWIPALNVLEYYRDIALFFAGFLPDETGQDLYTRLLEFLKTTGTLPTATFTSLNYDCLLELAAAHLALNINYFARDDEPSAVQVLKLHGSCNFITPELSARRPYLTNPGSFLGCQLHVLSPRNLQSVLKDKYREGINHYFYPILSLYAVGKNTHIGPEKIQEFRNTWSEEAAQATHLAIIGVRFNSQDDHITGSVKATPAHTVLYVGGGDDFNAWHRLNPNCKHLGERFEESFATLCDALL